MPSLEKHFSFKSQPQFTHLKIFIYREAALLFPKIWHLWIKSIYVFGIANKALIFYWLNMYWYLFIVFYQLDICYIYKSNIVVHFQVAKLLNNSLCIPICLYYSAVYRHKKAVFLWTFPWIWESPLYLMI